MAIVQKITNDNVENFENAVEIWTSMGKAGNFIGIYDTRRNFYHEEKGGCYTDDNHFRITNNLSGKEDVIVMDASSAINHCISLGEQGGLENFRTICSILWSNDNMGRYYLQREGCADRGSENLAILLYLCGQGVISRMDLANEIMIHSKTTECPHIMKEQFECPIADADTQPYTTEECGVCCVFWDCETGLKKCLNDDDYSDHHEDIKQALNNIQ